MALQKFGTPEPIQPEPDDAQGVDTAGIRREAAAGTYDPAEVLYEDEREDD